MLAAPVSWGPDANGFWDIAGNWNPGLPGAADDVTISVGGATVRTITFRSGTVTINSLTSDEDLAVTGGDLTINNAYVNTQATRLQGGALRLNGASTLASFNHTGGTLAGTGVVTISGVAALTSGTQTGTGTTIIQGATTFGSGYSLADGRVLELRGGATTPAAFTLNLDNSGAAGSGTLRNAAGSTFADGTTTSSSIISSTGQGSFENAGTYTKTGAGTTTIGVAFTNSGTLDIQNGIVQLSTTSTLGGTINLASGGVLLFNNGTHSINAPTFTGAADGIVRISGGTVTFTAATSVPTLQHQGGIMTGPGTVTAASAVLTGGGTMTGTSTTIIQGATTFGSGYSLADGRVLELRGGATTPAAFTLNLDNSGAAGSGTLRNAAGSTFADGTTTSSSIISSTGQGSFENAGTYTKTGAGTTTIGVAFTNSGTLDIQNGIVQLSTTSTLGGTINLASGGVLLFNNGTHSINAPTFTGAADGIVRISGGTVTFTAATSVPTLQHQGGIMTGPGTVTAASAVLTGGTMTGTGTTIIQGATTFGSGYSLADGRVLELRGGATTPTAFTLNLDNSGLAGSGTLRNASGSTFADGTTTSSSIISSTGQGAFENAGTYRKTGVGTTTVGVAFTNSGTVQVETGTFRMTGAVAGASGTTLTGAGWTVIGSPGGSTIDFDTGSGMTSLVTNAAFVRLIGANSNIVSGAGNTGIEATLITNSATGALIIGGGRSYVATAGGGAFVNAGVLELQGGSFGATSLTNSGDIDGNGSVGVAITNTGTVRASGGTLTTLGINGSGAIVVTNGATLDASGAAANLTAGTLTHNGASLNLGARSITVTNDYQNAAFGSGNAFNGRANVAGAGAINAASATQDLSAAGLSGNTLTLGNVRVGGTSVTQLTVTNNGTSTVLRGAVQNGSAPGVTLSNADFVVGPNGGSSVASISFTGSTAGALTGQTINVVNNFDNVADATINLVGAAFNAAVGSVTPGTVNIGNVRVGSTASGAITIANTAPAGAFSEGLRVTGTGFTGGAGVNGVTSGVIAAGSSDAANVTLSTATAGTQSGTVSFSFATNGTGTSGLAEAAIAGAVVNVNANVYALANAGVTPSIAFGNVRVGDVASRTVAVTNAALGGVPAGFQEGLNASVSSTPAGFGSSGSVTNLAAGGAGTLVINLDTATAGARSGNAVVALASNGTGTSGLATLDLAPANVALSGGVYNRAVGAVTPDPVNLGNVRVGGTASGIVTIANTAGAGLFSEALAVTGTTTSGGASIGGVTAGLIAAGGSSNATVGLSTASAGARSGTVNFSFATDGTGTSGLAAEAIAGAAVTINANVYALANPFISSPLQFGNVQQGSVQTRTITVENRQLGGVLAAFQEGLNAGIGVISGDVQLATGNIVNLAAGGIDTTTLTVRLNTGSAGSKTGTVEILLQSNGTGTSGLGNLDLPAQTVAVLGQVEAEATVYRLAEATLTPTSVAFGSRRVGDAAPSQVLTITNIAAADGFSERLDAVAGGTSGRATVSGGPVTLLAAGSSSGAIAVGVDTSVAGANGSVTINFASNGAGTSGFGITALPSQVVTLGGAVYQAASAGAQPAAITLAARRVGDAAASSTLTIANTAPGTGGFTEALSATVTGNNGFTANGGGQVITANLGVGGSQNIAISRGTGTAGAFSGSVAIANTSRAEAGSGLADLALAGQSVTVAANVYAAAVADVAATTVDFGTVRQGASAPVVAVGITNAAGGALTDSLITSVGALPAGITGTAPGALAAGETANASFALATATAGVVSGNGSLGFVSANPEMADLALASQAISFTGTVTELAVAELFKAGGPGSLIGSGNAYTLNLGAIRVGSSGSLLADLGVRNGIVASSFSESLGGSFVLTPGLGYAFTGTDFAGLAGGGTSIGNLLSFDVTGLAVGVYSTTLTFNGFSRYTGLADQSLGPVQLTVTTRVAAVPEPAIWAQLIIGFGAVGGLVRRRRAVVGKESAC